jgi:hypothetical protein
MKSLIVETWLGHIGPVILTAFVLRLGFAKWLPEIDEETNIS